MKVLNKRNSEEGVYIGRPSKWGNPFVIGRDGDRASVIAKYETWLQQQPALIAAARKELRGKDLVCYCAPLPCHGDILMKIANEVDLEALQKEALPRRNVLDSTPTKKTKWPCNFCDKLFITELGFMNHRCREQERLKELRSPLGQTAYQYYSEWLRLKKRSIPPIETFSTSRLYTTFVKFAQHVQKVSMPYPLSFIRSAVNLDIQPTLWCRDNVYAAYLQRYDEVVEPAQQFTDSLEFIQELAVELEVSITSIFQSLGVKKILTLVQKRKLSPWFLVSSKQFREFMGEQNELDKETLEAAIQVGAMVLRLQTDKEAIELFVLFSKVAAQEGL